MTSPTLKARIDSDITPYRFGFSCRLTTPFVRARHTIGDHEPVGTNKPSNVEKDEPESLDPNDSDLLRDELKGETVEHAKPPRLEDEGQSGG
jgi:hypothetical protein